MPKTYRAHILLSHFTPIDKYLIFLVQQKEELAFYLIPHIVIQMVYLISISS
jgi:hypothetical protein